jgi:hypothetical protein
MLLLTFLVFCTQCGQFGTQILPGNETLKVDLTEIVEFCHMLDHPNDFDGKEVQTTAILVAGRFPAFMYDARCIDKKRSVYFEVDSGFANEQLARFLGAETPEFKATGLERVRGKFVGTFQAKKNTGFGPMNSYEYRFVITKTDELSYVPIETPYPW